MYTLKEMLWNILGNLREEQFKHFQWFLKGEDIPESQLEKADRLDTVDLLVQKYSSHDAVEVTKTILKKIRRNDLVERLNNGDPENHDYERKAAELTEAKAQIATMIQERLVKVRQLKQAAALSHKSADRQTRETKQIFTELLQSVQRILADLVQAIEEKRKTAQKHAEGFIKELEKDISDLTKRSAELEQLSHIREHEELLRSYASLHAAAPAKSWTELSVPPPPYGRAVGNAVDQLKHQVGQKTQKLMDTAKLRRVQQFAREVTLDPDTANAYLVLSEDRKQVHCGNTQQNVPEKPQRFDQAINVLGKQSISSGRFYYEVRVAGSSSWDLGVARESVHRKGPVEAKPANGYWTMCLRNGDKYKAPATNLSVQTPPETVGVFVDYTKGSVCFYDADSAAVLHCFSNCSFQEELRPFFSPGLQRGENPTPLIITAVNLD